MDDKKYKTLRAAEDLTDEIKEYAVTLADDRFGDGRISDWEEVWERMDGMELADGVFLDLDEVDNPAMRALKMHVRDARKAG